MTSKVVLSRAACCAACLLGCCAIASHNIHFYIERPGEPCIYSAPCNPRQPLADIPEQQHEPMPSIIGTKLLVVVSAVPPASPDRLALRGIT